MNNAHRLLTGRGGTVNVVRSPNQLNRCLGTLRRILMFPRVRNIAAAAVLAAAALYLPGPVHADQDDAGGRVAGGAGNAARRPANLYIAHIPGHPVCSYTRAFPRRPATRPH